MEIKIIMPRRRKKYKKRKKKRCIWFDPVIINKRNVEMVMFLFLHWKEVSEEGTCDSGNKLSKSKNTASVMAKGIVIAQKGFVFILLV